MLSLLRFIPSAPTLYLIALLAGAGMGSTVTISYYHAKLKAQQAAALEQQAKAVQLVADAQQAQFDKLQGALNVAQAQTKQANADADAARNASGKLRTALASFKAKHSTACPSAGEPSGDPIGVLTDLLGRMDAAGQRISRYADEVKIAGAACEATWPK